MIKLEKIRWYLTWKMRVLCSVKYHVKVIFWIYEQFDVCVNRYNAKYVIIANISAQYLDCIFLCVCLFTWICMCMYVCMSIFFIVAYICIDGIIRDLHDFNCKYLHFLMTLQLFLISLHRSIVFNNNILHCIFVKDLLY
jgi:hypothetical protein